MSEGNGQPAMFHEPTQEEMDNARVSYRHGVMDVVIGGVNIGGLALAAYLGEPISRKLINNLARQVEAFSADLATRNVEAFETWRKFCSTGAEGAVLTQTKAMVQRIIKESHEEAP